MHWPDEMDLRHDASGTVRFLWLTITHAMNRLVAVLAAIAVTSISLGAGCTPKEVASQSNEQGGPARDSVVVPGVGHVPTDLIRHGELSVGGAASFEMMTVAEVTLRLATSREQAAAADRAVNSGAYLGDSLRVVHVSGQQDQGVIGYAVGSDVGTGFETEYVVHFGEGGGETTFEIVGEPLQPGRRMPSMFRVVLSLGKNGGDNGIVLMLGDEGASPSELGRVSLPDVAPGTHAYRIGIRYVPGSITVLLNGRVVLEEVARLGGGSASAAILARPAESAYVLSWTFETLP